MPSIKKLDIACQLLEQALRLYYEGEHYFAALHLAGGAEEVLGKHIEALGRETSFASLRDSAVRITAILNEDGKPSEPKTIADVMNRAKNSTKHMSKVGDDEVSFDPRVAAKDMLDRAVSNYYTAMEFFDVPETPLVRRFNSDMAGH